MSKQGVGKRVLRKEDDRYMRGRGKYVADIRMAGMQDVAFVRSPVAHARLNAVHAPEGYEDQVFTIDHLNRAGVKPIVADTALPGFRSSAQPILAEGKVRHVGEMIAMCLAKTRAQAEDIAAAVQVDYDELDAVYDMLQGRKPDAPRLHEAWPDNLFLTTDFSVNIDAVRDAPIKVNRKIRTSRQAMAPMEGRGCVAYWDTRVEQLIIYTATQIPHIVRSGLAECLGLPEAQVRVITPDVGGGFGYKGILLPEEVAVSWLAMHVGHPVRWLEDRREHLTASANCREHYYDITCYASADGRLLGIECEATVDSGAYSSYPFSACLEAGQVGSILPGPYDFPSYHCETYSVATNKCPILPYRGVGRTGVCFALELVLDDVAREAGVEPYELRMKSLVKPEQMPFDNITNKHFDSGDYPEALRRAVEAIDVAAIRERQKRPEPDGRLIGVGLAVYCEQAAHGTSVYSGWGIPMVPGHEQATLRITPDGGLEIRIGAHSHGQSLETTLAQVANEKLGIDIANIKVIHGDTEYTPYSTGTWGSRCMVMSGGAVSRACDALLVRLKEIGAFVLKTTSDKISVADGMVYADDVSMPVSEVARIWYRRPQDLPPGASASGLEVTEGYKPGRDTGTFGYGVHAALVAVDPQTGDVEILDYVIVEDGGKLVNPMVVDGQIYGGTAQGIGTALYEEMPFDASAQPLASTFADYLLPGPTEIPEPRLIHMETLSPYTEFGVKGIGESGAIAPPATILNAINDALHPLGAALYTSPATPHRVLEAIFKAREAQGEIPGFKVPQFEAVGQKDTQLAGEGI
ncbi:MAG TPA: xanthine dehydrogenase family protein molybdopterin-binding subunit [Pusillimonas sp.]|uniref:xanthine dehydrogenase family protein molybdopterin-binding subunit n=1 Tax=unclassified Pusillimonas TaxID=2640016 RepID=UPI002638E71B|nr:MULTISPECIES: xanthine dehydrogenase family protein molybdopterin-binding subunit [unclassified Pusillimonas]HLU18632.1 xanthine dehydrogenase family protein molybdopterin-binding subunit [Pusillimonas sp.]